MSGIMYKLNHQIVFTEPELSKVRADMLAEIEEYIRTGKMPRNPKFVQTHKKRSRSRSAKSTQPLYLDNDFLADPLYKSLSVVAKITWLSMIQTEHRLHEDELYQIATHPSKTAAPALTERNLNGLIWLTAFATVGGKVLTIEDLRNGVEELRATGFIHIDTNDRVSFPKYVSFGKPPASRA